MLNLNNLTADQLESLGTLLTPRVNKYMKTTFQPKQAVFLMLPNLEVFFGGAAGGGKSWALLQLALQYVDEPNYHAVMFRKSYADLVKPGALIHMAKEQLAPFVNSKEVHWSEKLYKFTFPSGSSLSFGYLDNDNDCFKYQGSEFQCICFDEMTHLSENNVRYLFSRLRKTANNPVPLRIRGASNPASDDSAMWIYDRYIDPEKKVKDTIFIPASFRDNKYLDHEEYEKTLENLDSVTRAQLRDGVWKLDPVGSYFKRNWFEFVDHAPPYRKIVRSWDLASTAPSEKNRDPDWTVGLRLSEYQGIYYLEDIVSDRIGPAGVEEMQGKTASSDGRRITILEELQPGAAGKMLEEMKARGVFKGYNYRTMRPSSSKTERALPASAAAEKGLIKVVRGCRNIDAFFNNIEGFPNSKHDDYVDAFTQAFNGLANVPVITSPLGMQNKQGSYWGGNSPIGESYWRSI